MAAIDVRYEPLEPLVDAEEAVSRAARCSGASTSGRGDPAVTGAVVVEGTYEVGMQDQAPLGPESGMAVPDGQGGVDLYVATQWTHTDHAQIVACLGIAEDQVRVHHAGIGGAFGAREDVSLQIHLCLLALATGRPVKMVYDRKESFVGHVHRHPARMWYRHEATPDGDLVRVGARMVFDGGAYASSSTAVVANASYFAVGPVPVRQRVRRVARHQDEQPSVRRHAGLRRGAGMLRARGADGPARRGVWGWTRSS